MPFSPILPVLQDCAAAHSMQARRSKASRRDQTSRKPGERPAPRESTRTQAYPSGTHFSGSTNKYQNWEVVDPEKWVPDGYACVRVDSRGAGRSPGHIDHFSPRATPDLYLCIEWACVQP